MGLSLVEFETYVSEILEKNKIKDYETDYESHLSIVSGLVQSRGNDFCCLVRVSSKTNNVEVYDHVYNTNKQEVGLNVLESEIGGVPLLDAPAGVLQSSLANDGNTHDEFARDLTMSFLDFGSKSLSEGVKSILTGDKFVSVSSEALSVKGRVWEEHKHLFKDLPELILSSSDMQLMARYCSSRSNMPSFTKMYASLAAVERTDEKGSTLYVQSVGLTRRLLRYNPAFIAKTIVQDMLAKKVGLLGMEKYGGAFASLAYMIGHELLHVLYNHFDKDVKQNLVDMQLPPILNKTNSKMLKRVMSNTVPIEELMNNSVMSSMFDMPAVNGGYTVPEFRPPARRRRGGTSFSKLAAGRWYLSNDSVYPNANAVDAKLEALSDPYSTSELSERYIDDLTNGAGKIEYDRWYPAAFVVEDGKNTESKHKGMPNEFTFFADGTYPLPSFWGLELLMRRSLGATRKDEELVKVAPSYTNERKPKVETTNPPSSAAAPDETDSASSTTDDPKTSQQDQDPAKSVARVQAGDIALDKEQGVYQVILGVIDDGDPQELLSYPISRLPTALSTKIEKAIQGHKDSGVLDQETLSKAAEGLKSGGSPNAPVRLGPDAMASVTAAMMDHDQPKTRLVKGDKLRPVYLDVRDVIEIDQSQQPDAGDAGSQEPEPDIEVNNTPDMPPDEDDSQMGGGGGQDDGSNDPQGDDTEDSDDSADEPQGDGADDGSNDAGQGDSSDDGSNDAGQGDSSDDGSNDAGQGDSSDDGTDDAGQASSGPTDQTGSGSGAEDDPITSAARESALESKAAGGDTSDMISAATQAAKDAGANPSVAQDIAEKVVNDIENGQDSTDGQGGDDSNSSDDDSTDGQGAGDSNSSDDDDATNGDDSNSSDADSTNGDDSNSSDADSTNGDDSNSSDDDDATNGDDSNSSDADSTNGDDSNSSDADSTNGDDSNSSDDDDATNGDDSNSSDADSTNGDDSNSSDADSTNGDDSNSSDADSTNGDDSNSSDSDSTAGQGDNDSNSSDDDSTDGSVDTNQRSADDADGATSAEETSAAQQEQDWDNYLESLANDQSKSTLGSNDEVTTDAKKSEDEDEDGQQGNDSVEDEDAEVADDGGSSQASGDDNGFDSESLFDRNPDSAEAREERKRKQKLLKDQLSKLAAEQDETDREMDQNRKEREDNEGKLSADTQKAAQSSNDSQTGQGGFSYGGKAKADQEVKKITGLIQVWGRSLKGQGFKMDVGYNANKLSRRIKGAWGSDDDVPVPKGRTDKALFVIIDTSASLSQFGNIITKTIAATLESLGKKMGVSYVIPISFDGASRQTGIYSLEEVDSQQVMGRFMAGSGSRIEPAFRHMKQVLDGTARMDKDVKYRGTIQNIVIGGVLCLTDFDITEGWSKGEDGQFNTAGDIPADLVKKLTKNANNIPWLNVCWMVDDGSQYPNGSGLASVSYLKRFHIRNAKNKKLKFTSIASTRQGVASKVPIKSDSKLTRREIQDVGGIY